MKTRVLQPLRRVRRITETGRTGQQIGPHCFWLAHEFKLNLECGHAQLRVRDVYDDLDTVKQSLPKRVRCEQCNPVERKVRSAPQNLAPQWDYLALDLNGSFLAVGGSLGDMVDVAYLSDEAQRRQAHVRVAAALVSYFAPAAGHERTNDILAALRSAHDDPSDTQLAEIRRQTRRLYHSQHRGQGSWYARRGIIAAIGVIVETKAAATKYGEALSWADTASRDTFYEALRDLRQRYDDQAGMVSQLSEMADQAMLDGLGDYHVNEELVTHANETWKELEQAYAAQQWSLSAEIHTPIITRCLAAYRAKDDASWIFDPVLSPASM